MIKIESSTCLGAILAVALAALAAPPRAEAAAAENMHLKIRNRASAAITVYILRGGGDVQKQETVAPGKSHRFKFEWCATCCGHDKQRDFEVKRGDTLLASGTLDMNTRKVVTGPEGETDCSETNTMELTDEDEGDAWTFSGDYENAHRTAVITAEN
jgi:hypothetical protein